MKGLTWDHPRGYRPLDELARREGGIAWARQPLEGFESTPIADLAAEYDLLVVDHPGLGSALDSLIPLEAVLAEEELAAWRANTIGASYDSYVLEGRTWALPIDAAAQVAAGTISDPPRTWAEVRELARDGRVTLCLGGPHALLTFFALCLARGASPLDDKAESGMGAAAGEWAIELMAELVAAGDGELWRHNPISVLEATPVYCPLVYGYVTYSTLSFWDAPVAERRGSVLGGTGVAVSRRADPAEVRPVLRRLIAPDVQRELFPAFGGQPADREFWFSSTKDTIETAWVRPRDAGYIAFQAEGSRLLRDGIDDRVPAGELHRRLENTYREWRKR